MVGPGAARRNVVVLWQPEAIYSLAQLLLIAHIRCMQRMGSFERLEQMRAEQMRSRGGREVRYIDM